MCEKFSFLLNEAEVKQTAINSSKLIFLYPQNSLSVNGEAEWAIKVIEPFKSEKNKIDS